MIQLSSQDFTATEVKNAITSFNNFADDIERANVDTWADHLYLLITHCHQNPVMQTIMHPLIAYPDEQYKTWFEARQNASGRKKEAIPFPADEDERTAIYYKLIVQLLEDDNKRSGLVRLCRKIYGMRTSVANHRDNVTLFKKETFSQFRRTISARLVQLQEHQGADTPVISKEALIVFHIENNQGTVVTGGIQADHSQVAVGHSQISSSTITDNQQLKAELLKLNDMLDTVEEGNRSAVQQAVATLVQAADNPTTSKVELASAVETVKNNSNPMAQFLKDMTSKTGASVAAHGIIQAINFVIESMPGI